MLVMSPGCDTLCYGASYESWMCMRSDIVLVMSPGDHSFTGPECFSPPKHPRQDYSTYSSNA
uniref:Uncharacterized protein n=1 Tax=Arion vulgaris TaxID=1028688 RepID=A0A0B7A0T4_9EUPU